MRKSFAFITLRVPLRIGIVALALVSVRAPGYERYSGCAPCHGKFTGSTSPQGTVFPSGDKHVMHRSSSYMGTACDLCHRSDDDRDPFIKSSDGATGVPGIGCVGCHVGSGLRAHHAANGIAECDDCHNATTPPAESASPPYYGTAFTKAKSPANGVLLSNTNENWSVGDFVGLDNDGDNLYDLADFDCGPYRVVQVVREGNNVRVTFQTAGGRRDIIQAAPSPNGTFTNVSPVLSISGVGVVVTNFLDENGASSNGKKFYRLKNSN